MYKSIFSITFLFCLNVNSLFTQITIENINKREIHHFKISPTLAYFLSNDNISFALGLGYEFQYSRNFGLGLSAIGFINNKFQYKIEVPVYYHPYDNFWISFAPGLIYTDFISYSREFIETPEQISRDEKLTGNFVLSTNIAYEINLNESNSIFAIAPYASLNLINIEQFIFKIGFKTKFKHITYKKIEIK